jgi:hypothetical protein
MQKARAFRPKYEGACRKRGSARAEAGDRGGAVAERREALALRPDSIGSGSRVNELQAGTRGLVDDVAAGHVARRRIAEESSTRGPVFVRPASACTRSRSRRAAAAGTFPGMITSD